MSRLIETRLRPSCAATFLAPRLGSKTSSMVVTATPPLFDGDMGPPLKLFDVQIANYLEAILNGIKNCPATLLSTSACLAPSREELTNGAGRWLLVEEDERNDGRDK